MPAGDEESWDFPPAAASHPRVASSMGLTRVQPELFAQALSLPGESVSVLGAAPRCAVKPAPQGCGTRDVAHVVTLSMAVQGSGRAGTAAAGCRGAGCSAASYLGSKARWMQDANTGCRVQLHRPTAQHCMDAGVQDALQLLS